MVYCSAIVRFWPKTDILGMCGLLTITVPMAEAPIFGGVFDDNAESNASGKKVVKWFAFFAYCMPYRRLKSG
jgi:hypothetical protein